jgi:O-glycosyl hydrolase
MSHEHRVKIQNSNILNALIEHAEGTREMGATQVTAALGLLKKALPDLSATTISGEDGGPVEIGVIERVIVKASNKDR